PVHVREHQIGQHDVRTVPTGELQGITAPICGHYLVSLLLQQPGTALHEQLLVVDEQDREGFRPRRRFHRDFPSGPGESVTGCTRWCPKIPGAIPNCNRFLNLRESIRRGKKKATSVVRGLRGRRSSRGLGPAATYSPTRSPGQYHPRCGA